VTPTPAAALAEALGGWKVGCTWMARCPVHDDRTPSLAISEADDGRVLVHCHAGCSQQDVIAALRACGAWNTGAYRPIRVLPKFVPETSRAAMRRTEAALRIWRASRHAAGTPADSYLRRRGLHLPTTPVLRFHDGLKHPSGSVWPALVALVTRGADDTAIGIHRTFLALEGMGKAPVEPAKMMLGPCRGGAVRLAPESEPLLVGEGVETSIAAMQSTGYAAWAALSTSGMSALVLPQAIRNIIILADGDAPGEAAAIHAARRWRAEGRRVRIARPPSGSDFNDVLLGRDAPTGESRP